MGVRITEAVRTKINKKYGTDFKKTARWDEVIETVIEEVDISLHADVHRNTVITVFSEIWGIDDKFTVGPEYWVEKDGYWDWPEICRVLVEYLLANKNKRKKQTKKK